MNVEGSGNCGTEDSRILNGGKIWVAADEQWWLKGYKLLYYIIRLGVQDLVLPHHHFWALNKAVNALFSRGVVTWLTLCSDARYSLYDVVLLFGRSGDQIPALWSCYCWEHEQNTIWAAVNEQWWLSVLGFELLIRRLGVQTPALLSFWALEQGP